MSSRRVRTGCDPHGHGSGRPNVAQRLGDRSTGRDSAGPDLIEAPVQRLREVEVHECTSAQTALPFHIGDFAAAASIASSTIVESRENPFYGSPHRRLPMSLLLRGGLVVTQDEKRRVVTGDVLLEDGRIVAVGDVDRSADDVIDCSGCAVLPGFINLHQHVANTLLRGVADDVPLEDMALRASAIDAKLTRRDVQIGALLGCVEMIRSGTTSFHDLFYWEDEVARAARESGMRGFLSWVTLADAFTTRPGSPLKNADAFVAKQKDDSLVTHPSASKASTSLRRKPTRRRRRSPIAATSGSTPTCRRLAARSRPTERRPASDPWSGSRRSGSSVNGSPRRTAPGSR